MRGWGGDNENSCEGGDLWRAVSGGCGALGMIDAGLTISDSLARAGNRVRGASRWRSTPSKTSTKRKWSGRGVYLSILLSSTVSWDTVSHLDGAASHARAWATLATTLS